MRRKENPNQLRLFFAEELPPVPEIALAARSLEMITEVSLNGTALRRGDYLFLFDKREWVRIERFFPARLSLNGGVPKISADDLAISVRGSGKDWINSFRVRAREYASVAREEA